MKLVVLADIHGNLTALEAVLSDLATQAPYDALWVLGDLASHGTRPNECVTRIRELATAQAEKVSVIGGNTERYLITNARPRRQVIQEEGALDELRAKFAQEDRLFEWSRNQLSWENFAYLGRLIGKECATYVAGFGQVIGYHAVPGDDETSITATTPDDVVLDSVLDHPARLGIYGHIHCQVNRFIGNFRLVNPGSVGLSFETPAHAQYAVLDFVDGQLSVVFHAVPYDVEAVIQDAYDVSHPSVATLEAVLRKGR